MTDSGLGIAALTAAFSAFIAATFTAGVGIVVGVVVMADGAFTVLVSVRELLFCIANAAGAGMSCIIIRCPSAPIVSGGRDCFCSDSLSAFVALDNFFASGFTGGLFGDSLRSTAIVCTFGRLGRRLSRRSGRFSRRLRRRSGRLRLGRRRRRRGFGVSADRALAVGIIRAVLGFRLLVAAAAGTGMGVRSVVVGSPGRPAAVAVRMRTA